MIMKSKVTCPKCEKEFMYETFSLYGEATCPHCKMKYAVQKNRKYRIYSFMLCFIVLAICEYLQLSKVVEIVVLLVFLAIIEFILEYIVVHLLGRGDKFYQFIEKTIQ